jgi:hypothetical protein
MMHHQYGAPMGVWGCHHCGYRGPPKYWSKVSTGGWILLVLLILSVIGAPFFWIGLLLKTGGKMCPACYARYM